MTATARKYNPGFLSDDELVASFCVRTVEFESMMEVLRECTEAANTHQIVIGPRGSGKTSLLLRIAAEIRRDDGLFEQFVPVVFAEESYEVSTAGEFWLECLSRLADQVQNGDDGPDLRRTADDLRSIQDDRLLGDRCLGALQDFSDREGKRLVLIVENLNMMFRDMPGHDDGWRLRHTLQTEPRIVLMASATSRFDEIDNPDRALYDLFRVLTLRPLDTAECAVLWETVTGRPREHRTIRALQILTGGSPRLLAIVARFGAQMSFRDLMAELLDLVDDHTEYFKSHLESLASQERRVYLALARLWQPASAREVADAARLDTNTCSAQLKRLTDRGAVYVEGGSARRRRYYLSERLYNIYYLMRRARGPDPMIQGLVHFMEAYYSQAELREFGTRLVREAAGLDQGNQLHYLTALDRLATLPSLATHREELRSLAQGIRSRVSAELPYASDASTAIATAFIKNFALAAEGHAGKTGETLQAIIEIVSANTERVEAADLTGLPEALLHEFMEFVGLDRIRHFLASLSDNADHATGSVTPASADATAHAGRALTLLSLDQPDEALAAADEALQHLPDGDAPLLAVASSLAKTVALVLLNRLDEAPALWNAMEQRISDGNSTDHQVANQACFVAKGMVLIGLDRPERALSLCHEMERRIADRRRPEHKAAVIPCLLMKGLALFRMNRFSDSLAVLDDVLPHIPEEAAPMAFGAVSAAFAAKGDALIRSNRPAEAISVFDLVVERFGESEVPDVNQTVATTLAAKAGALNRLDRQQEALGVFDKALSRFEKTDATGTASLFAATLFNRGNALIGLGRTREAIEVWEGLVERFEEDEREPVRDMVAMALFNRGIALCGLVREGEILPDDILAAWDKLLDRFAASDEPRQRDSVAKTLFTKIEMLISLDRAEEALAACDDLLRRFEASYKPSGQQLVAMCRLHKGEALLGLDRFEDALATWDTVLPNLDPARAPELAYSMAKALAGSSIAFLSLKRPQEALDACDRTLRQFDANRDPMIAKQVAWTHYRRSVALARLKRFEEALAAANGTVEYCEANAQRGIRQAADEALVIGLRLEMQLGLFHAAIRTVERLLGDAPGKEPENRCWLYLNRARAYLEISDETAFEQDVRTTLEILPTLDPLPGKALIYLSQFAVQIEPQKMLDLVRESPAAQLLLPLTIALERELGLEPQVAKEVEEVAEDIRSDLAR